MQRTGGGVCIMRTGACVVVCAQQEEGMKTQNCSSPCVSV